MGKPKKHDPVKLICGMISGREELFDEAQTVLESSFGRIDFRSEVLEFNFTDYYRPEMGSNLKRLFVSFQDLIPPDKLADVKLRTNEIESQFRFPGTERRMINLDPGYITTLQLVLATTKPHIHRIYLRDGIYAETTLRYYKKTWQPWQWTYPDYQTDEYRRIFHEIRSIYVDQLHQLNKVEER